MDAVDGFLLRVEKEGCRTVVRVSGELDVATSSRLRDCLAELNGHAVTVDLRNVTFLDSSALAVLLWKHREGHMALRGVQPAQMRVFEVSGLDHLFRFDGSA